MSDEHAVEEIAAEQSVDAIEERQVGEEAEAAEVSAEGEESASSDEAQEGQDKPKRRSRAEERINALTKEKYEAQRQIEDLHRQMADLQSKTKQDQLAQSMDSEAMPSLADYGYDEDAYRQAVTQWSENRVKRYQEGQEAMRQQAEQQEAYVKQQVRLQEAMARGQEKHPDFMSVVMNPNLPSLADVSQAAFEAMIDSDNPDEIAYYLASNPDTIYSLAGMTPVQAIKEVAKIEAKLGVKPAKPSVPPKPVPTVGGSSESAPNPDAMSTDDWMAWRNRQVTKR